MAVRTTSTEVKQILIDTELTDAQIDNFITIASAIVDDLDTDTTLTDARLEMIEQYLTCHLIASGPERQMETEKLGDASIKYSGKYGLALDSTTYGQTAAMLDTSGTLRGLGGKKAKIRAITSFDS